MVLAIVSVRPEGTRFFALAERKKRNTKEDEVPLRKIISWLPRKSCKVTFYAGFRYYPVFDAGRGAFGSEHADPGSGYHKMIVSPK
jgi:hypothetical protein